MSDTVEITEAWLAETERLAGEATAGPWRRCCDRCGIVFGDEGRVYVHLLDAEIDPRPTDLRPNAAHIARVDPAAVTAWAAETRRAWAERDAYRELILAYTEARQAIEDHVEECEDCDGDNRLCDEAVKYDVVRLVARHEFWRLAGGLTDVDSALAALDRARAALRADAPAGASGEKAETK